MKNTEYIKDEEGNIYLLTTDKEGNKISFRVDNTGK